MTGTAVVSTWRRVLRFVGLALLWFCLLLVTLWSTAALYFDVPNHRLRLPLAVLYIACIIVALVVVRTPHLRKSVCLIGFVIVLVWWLSLKPSNDRPWQADVAQRRGWRYRVTTLRFTIFGTANIGPNSTTRLIGKQRMSTYRRSAA